MGGQPPRQARPGSKSMFGGGERGAWATTSLCAKSRRTPLLTRCVLASSLLTTRTGHDLLVLLSSLWFWSTMPRPPSGRRGTRPMCPSHAWPTGLREWGGWVCEATSGHRCGLDSWTRASDCEGRQGLATLASPFACAPGHSATWAQFRGRPLWACVHAMSGS